MNRKMVWPIVVVTVVLALAVAGVVSVLMTRNLNTAFGGRIAEGWGMRGMGSQGFRDGSAPGGTRLSLDEAALVAERYAADSGANLQVAEVMEFADNFYAIVQEKDTGRGAFEILIDPFSGAARSEPGPNMMWNAKYGHMMSRGTSAEDVISLVQARALAQQALDQNIRGAQVEGTGTAFYGYFTFDYEIDGKIAGMLSINAATGDHWLHTWHGAFIAEEEMGL